MPQVNPPPFQFVWVNESGIWMGTNDSEVADKAGEEYSVLNTKTWVDDLGEQITTAAEPDPEDEEEDEEGEEE